MRTWRFLLAMILGALAFSTTRAEDDPQSAAAIRELVRRGAVVKKFAVIESETQGLLVRLKAEHIDRNGKIDADILATLQPLKELSLELRSLPLSDTGLKSLLAKVTLVGLDVSGSEISDRGLQVLASARVSLRLLDLSFTRISDEGLASVASQSELRHLSLIDCRVTDCGIESLSRLARLREIYLAKTAVSASAAEQLRRRLPACRIDR